MEWKEIQLTCKPDVAETLADLLIDFTGRGIVQEDIPATSPHNPALQRFKAYLPWDADGEDMVPALEDAIRERIGQKIDMTIQIIPEEDWAQNWKAFFKPMHITDKIVVKPSWIDFAFRKDQIIIEIDPGRAFGVGSHPSTRLAMQALEQAMSGPDFRNTGAIKVLDVGTGTGILAMAAARLGAQYVMAIDLDPEAVVVASENVCMNNLKDKVSVSGEDLSQIAETFSIILANITYPELIRICPALFKLLSLNSVLITSGILKEQAEDLLHIYERQGLQSLATRAQDEWVCLSFRKK